MADLPIEFWWLAILTGFLALLIVPAAIWEGLVGLYRVLTDRPATGRVMRLERGRAHQASLYSPGDDPLNSDRVVSPPPQPHVQRRRP